MRSLVKLTSINNQIFSYIAIKIIEFQNKLNKKAREPRKVYRGNRQKAVKIEEPPLHLNLAVPLS